MDAFEVRSLFGGWWKDPDKEAVIHVRKSN
jgi:hypothetical protein